MKLTRRGLVGTLVAALGVPKLAALAPIRAQNVDLGGPIIKRRGLAEYSPTSYSLGFVVSAAAMKDDEKWFPGKVIRMRAEESRRREEELVQAIFCNGHSNT